MILSTRLALAFFSCVMVLAVPAPGAEAAARLAPRIFQTTAPVFPLALEAVANLCHDRNRWKRRHPSVAIHVALADSPAPAAWLPSAEAAPNLIVQQDELVDALQQAVADLPHDLRVTLLLYYYERLAYREIGVILGCSEKGIETRLYRARRQLRGRLNRFLGET